MNIEKAGDIQMISRRIITLVVFILFLCSNISFALHRPHYSRTEEDATQYLSSLAGSHIWFQKKMAYYVKEGNLARKLNNIEEVTLNGIDFDNNTFILERSNGEIINWKPEIYLKYNAIREMESRLQATFMTYNPYDEHPDWSEHYWNLIKNCQVEIGMTDSMVAYSLGAYTRKASIQRNDITIDILYYRGYDKTTAYEFEDDVLVGIIDY